MNNLIFQNNQFFKEIKSYFLGSLFALILTLIPFSLVYKHLLSSYNTLFIVIFCALIQFIVHIKYFLHLSFSTKNIWEIIFLIFTILIICIIIFGSMWIMYNLTCHNLHHRINNL